MKTRPITTIKIEAVAAEIRGAFTAQLFSVDYGPGPRDAILVMVPTARPTGRSVRVFYGTSESSGPQQAMAAMGSVARDDEQPAVEVSHSRHTVGDLEAFAARGLAAQAAVAKVSK